MPAAAKSANPQTRIQIEAVFKPCSSKVNGNGFGFVGITLPPHPAANPLK
jgi:hypothetical protein